MKDDELTIYIATHKLYKFTKNKYYCPIQVNAKKNEHFLPITDDMGDNISEKNNRFCELTALYWIWKNDHHSRYIGLCHYRRYFKMKFSFLDLLKAQYNKKYLEDKDVKVSSKIISWLEEDYIILPKPLEFGKISVQEQYENWHSNKDLHILKNVTLNMYPEFKDAWNRVFSGNQLHAFNMFIMNNENFDSYMKWLFSILSEVEKNIPPKDDVYQNRTFGFMSERLFNVFLEYKKCKVKELPIIFLT